MELDEQARKLASVEVVVVGNELLNGTTLDTNSHWLSKELTKLGAFVTRKTTVRDELSAITSVFVETITHRPIWIFSLGGLGPTFDDMTLRGIGNAVGRKVSENEEALRMLKRSYQRRSSSNKNANRNASFRLLKASKKMAQIPEGSVPLENSAGSAPGVLLEVGSTKIVALPGVPNELKSIFKEHVLPKLKIDFEGTARMGETWLKVAGIRESQIAPHIEKLMGKFSSHSIYIKSHPVGFDSSGNSILQIQIIGPKINGEGSKAFGEVSKYLQKVVRRLGGKVARAKSVR